MEFKELEPNTNVYNYLCCQIIGLIFYPLKLRLIIIYPAVFSISLSLLDCIGRQLSAADYFWEHAGLLNVSERNGTKLAKTRKHLPDRMSQYGICAPFLNKMDHQIQKSTKNT